MLNASVLCVDDEKLILEGLALTLRRKYKVFTATSGAEALDILKKNRFTSVVISDMRMPKMDGAAFLAKVKESNPLTVRMLLTGQADLEGAISAINVGQIFRFLVKPFPPPFLLKAVEAAMAQHQLLLSERVLLEQTLRGSIKLLTELLALGNPTAFGRANRIKQNAMELAERSKLPSTWQIEVAAMLSHIGYVTLPQFTMDKIYAGDSLDPYEQEQVNAQPALCDSLLSNIPRLDEVRAILLNQGKNFDGSGLPDNGLSGSQIPLGSRILKIATDFDTLEAKAHDPLAIIELMHAGKGRYDPKLLDCFAEVWGGRIQNEVIRTVPVGNLQLGMKFVEDVRTSAGVLMIPRAQELTETILERFRNLPRGIIPAEFQVVIPKPRPLSSPEALEANAGRP